MSEKNQNAAADCNMGCDLDSGTTEAEGSKENPMNFPQIAENDNGKCVTADLVESEVNLLDISPNSKRNDADTFTSDEGCVPGMGIQKILNPSPCTDCTQRLSSKEDSSNSGLLTGTTKDNDKDFFQLMHSKIMEASRSGLRSSSMVSDVDNSAYFQLHGTFSDFYRSSEPPSDDKHIVKVSKPGGNEDRKVSIKDSGMVHKQSTLNLIEKHDYPGSFDNRGEEPVPCVGEPQTQDATEGPQADRVARTLRTAEDNETEPAREENAPGSAAFRREEPVQERSFRKDASAFRREEPVPCVDHLQTQDTMEGHQADRVARTLRTADNNETEPAREETAPGSDAFRREEPVPCVDELQTQDTMEGRQADRVARTSRTAENSEAEPAREETAPGLAAFGREEPVPCVDELQTQDTMEGHQADRVASTLRTAENNEAEPAREESAPGSAAFRLAIVELVKDIRERRRETGELRFVDLKSVLGMIQCEIENTTVRRHDNHRKDLVPVEDIMSALGNLGEGWLKGSIMDFEDFQGVLIKSGNDTSNIGERNLQKEVLCFSDFKAALKVTECDIKELKRSRGSGDGATQSSGGGAKGQECSNVLDVVKKYTDKLRSKISNEMGMVSQLENELENLTGMRHPKGNDEALRDNTHECRILTFAGRSRDSAEMREILQERTKFVNSRNASQALKLKPQLERETKRLTRSASINKDMTQSVMSSAEKAGSSRKSMNTTLERPPCLVGANLHLREHSYAAPAEDGPEDDYCGLSKAKRTITSPPLRLHKRSDKRKKNPPLKRQRSHDEFRPSQTKETRQTSVSYWRGNTVSQQDSFDNLSLNQGSSKNQTVDSNYYLKCSPNSLADAKQTPTGTRGHGSVTGQTSLSFPECDKANQQHSTSRLTPNQDSSRYQFGVDADQGVVPPNRSADTEQAETVALSGGRVYLEHNGLTSLRERTVNGFFEVMREILCYTRWLTDETHAITIHLDRVLESNFTNILTYLPIYCADQNVVRNELFFRCINELMHLQCRRQVFHSGCFFVAKANSALVGMVMVMSVLYFEALESSGSDQDLKDMTSRLDEMLRRCRQVTHYIDLVFSTFRDFFRVVRVLKMRYNNERNANE